MDFATLTPSFVIVGVPFSKVDSMITVLPAGPKVDATAEATLLIPEATASFICSSKVISLYIYRVTS